MKYSDSGDYCVLYLESGDDRNALFNIIVRQQKSVVIILTEHARILQRPEDFVALKHMKRQLDVSIVFVIESSEHLLQLAGRHGFPVYSSMDALANALSLGHLGRQRVLNRTTSALDPGERYATPKRTIPLETLQEERSVPKTAPLVKKPLLTDTLPAKAAYQKRSEQQSAEQVQQSFSSPLSAEQSQWALPRPPAAKSRSKHFPLAMVALFMLAIVLAGLGSVLIFFNKTSISVAAAPPLPAIVGQVRFLSSGQISENSSQGINDEVVVDLNNLPDPSIGASYYAWLLSDKSQADLKVVLLGTLLVNKEHAHLLYNGDAQHTNLLLITSRFLVTEENAMVTPVSPSPDMSTWRYYGEFMQAPGSNPQDPKHFSYLDHLRHLLASDPTLDDLELPGGLNTWFYSNTGKILEWSNSMREQWEDAKDAGFVRRMAIRTLTYLDGLAFVQQDLPPGTPLLVNERLARIGLLNVEGPNQDPAGYIAHIDSHLNGLLLAGPTTPAFRKQLADIVTELDNVKSWLTQVHHDALLIMKMSDKQLQQAPTLDLINDMIANANYAYTGQTDPNTGQMHQGVVWIHEHIQELAALDITRFTSSGSTLNLIQDTKHMKAYH